MAATSISTQTSALKLDLVSPAAKLFSSKAKAPTSKVTAASLPVAVNGPASTATSAIAASLLPPLPASPTASGLPTANSSYFGASSGTTSPSNAGGNGKGSNPNTRSLQQRHMTMVSLPYRNTLLQRRQQQQQHRSSYGHGHPLIHQIQTHIQTHIRSTSQSHYSVILSPGLHKKTQSIHLAGRLEDIMSSSIMQGPLNVASDTTNKAAVVSGSHALHDPSEALMETKLQGGGSETEKEADYVYTAPCEHHPSKGQTDYLVNDMFPKLEASLHIILCSHDLSTIEFGIRIADFMPLAFKTVPVAGLAEKELELLHGLGSLPNVIQLQDSFVNDNGDTVLVLPMLKKFECQAVNQSLCSVRKTIKQILTGLAAVHAKNIVHLDINPSNLMVTHAKKDLVIIDFGLSMTVDRRPQTGTLESPLIPVCGTTGYIAPEILSPATYKAHDPTVADLYSLGIVLGEMLEPYIPDCDLHYFGSKYLSIQNTNQTVTHLNEFISQDCYYPHVLLQAADLLKNMLAEDPRERTSAQDLLRSHPFLTASPSAGCSASSGTLELCDWARRVQEIKYQKYLCQEQSGCEVYRYR
ncbi:hypothetical protein KVV02_006017 [Mortierella alpina]|uniref:Protein kinase domain-containing protein n=1 Tax=Mortierella alpina TaxID=64518 RepID=A0A9P8A456_MORAP|nr:hypothetical protein KVV02_006017 [Mortierella alpina]